MMQILKLLGLTPNDTALSWRKKWTTWLQAIQLALIAVIALYATLPERMQAVVSDTALGWVIGLAGLTTFLTVVAANAHQRNVETPVKYEPVTPLPPSGGGAKGSPYDQQQR